jgi:hypothetical protein
MNTLSSRNQRLDASNGLRAISGLQIANLVDERIGLLSPTDKSVK